MGLTARMEIGFQRKMLWIPVVMFVGLSAVGAALGRSSFSDPISIQFYLLDYLLINKIHALWGLVFYFTVNEWRESYRNGYREFVELAVVFTTVFTLFVLPVIFPELWDSPPYVFAFLLATKLVTLGHNVKQSFGISLLYVLKEKSNLSEEKSRLLEALLKREKVLHWLLIVGAFLTPDAGFAWAFARIDWIDHSVTIGLGLQVFALLGMYANSYRIGKIVQHQEKFKFDLRYLLYPAAHFSFAAFLAIRATHSFEYVLAMVQVVRKSKTTVGMKNRLKWLVPASGLLYGMFYLAPEIETALLGDISFTGAVVLKMAIAINVIHFYYDAKMFRMRNPKVRATVGPLLAIAKKA